MSQLLLTCEHAGNRVPSAYRAAFRDADQVLASHRGWDPGARSLAAAFARRLDAPLFCHAVTRLLVEPNRSLGHRQLFSEYTAGLDDPTRQVILRRYYFPHRQRVETWIRDQIAQDHTVVHLGLHTFTPSLNGQTRNADVGLLYDPSRNPEKTFCDSWHQAIQERRPDVRVRRNYPYRGQSDGFTTHLRRHFTPACYVGIELEVNQRWIDNSSVWNRLKHDLAESLVVVMAKEQA